MFGQGRCEVVDVLFPEDGRAAEREALLDLGQFEHQQPVVAQQRVDAREEAVEVADMFDDMTQEQRVEHALHSATIRVACCSSR